MSALLDLPLPRRMRRLPVVRLVHGRAAQRAWSWDLRDQWSREWWPQGITWAGERLLVSWYSRRGAGARVSVVDLAARRYAHVPLLTPDGAPLRVHAGGLAWDDGWLYVAATARGFWALHADDLVVTAVEEQAAVEAQAAVEEVAQQPSRDPATWRARTLHRPALPGSDEPFRWSFLDLTPAPSPVVEEGAQQPSRNPGATHLLAGEYGRSGRSTRLAHICMENGTPQGDLELRGEGPAGMQGVTTYADGLLVSTSAGPWMRGSLQVAGGASTSVPGRGGPGTTSSRLLRRGAPIGVEDLTRDRLGRLWTVAEHPGRRAVVRLNA